MATSFPGSLDSYVNPTGSDQLSTGPVGGVSHATMHANVNDAVEALQAKVGVDGSSVTSSLDYRVASLEGKDFTVTFGTGSDLSGAFTVTNLGNVTNTTVAVRDDSHTHDGRYFTETEADARFLGITAKAADADKLDGLDSGSFLRSDADDTTTGSLTVGGTGKYLKIKDTVDDTHTVTFATANLTNNRTITFPNAAGTVSLEGHNHDDDYAPLVHTHPYLPLSGGTLTGAVTTSSNIIFSGNSYIQFEGSTADSYETKLYATNPTGDRNIYLPNAGGTIALTADFANASVSYASSAGTATYATSSGSSSNADTVDTLHASSFLRSDEADTGTGTITISKNSGQTWSNAQFVADGGSGTAAIALRSYTSNIVQLRAGANGITGRNMLYVRDSGDQNDQDLKVADLVAGGNIYYNGATLAHSSRTVKENIEDYDGATSVIEQLRPVTFQFINGNGSTQIGLIAEEVQEVLPIAVDDTSDVLSLNQNTLLGLALAGLKEANKRIAVLEARVAELGG